MEIKNRISFDYEKVPELYRYLVNNDIAIEELMPNSTVYLFDIYESSPHWEYISDILKKKGVSTLCETIFSKKELSEARWLKMRSKWRNGYPLPIDGNEYRTITYTSEKYCEECGCGLQQVDAFRINKALNWGKRHFMMLNWVEDELFVSEVAKEILQREGYSHISFHEVKNKRGTEVIPGIWQMKMHGLIERGLLDEQERIREVLICPKCGSKKHHPNGRGMYKFRKEVFGDAPDIVRTTDELGWGSGSSRMIIVSQRFYQTILKNHLERSLVFEPIELV